MRCRTEASFEGGGKPRLPAQLVSPWSLVLSHWSCAWSRVTLREHSDDHTAVLGTSVLGLVRGNGLLRAVADHVHLVQRNLVLVVQVPLHGLGALHADLLVDLLAADAVGVAFDFKPRAVRIG